MSDGQFDYKIFDRIGVRNSYQNQGLDNLKLSNFQVTNNLTFTHFLLRVKMSWKHLSRQTLRTLQDGTLEKLSKLIHWGAALWADIK